MASYTKSEQKTVELVGLRFLVMHREFTGDGGPTIEVFADIGGQDTMVLKFDCFRKMPHFHAPGTDTHVLRLDPATVGDGQEWVLARIREHLPEMLATAGFSALAKTIDRQALAKGWTKVRDAIAATAPAAV